MTYRLPILLTLGLAVALVLLASRTLLSQGGNHSTSAVVRASTQTSAGAVNRPDGKKALPAADGNPQAQAILEAAIRSLESRQSISAQIRQRADLFGHQLIGSGRYLESRRSPIPLIRLELRTQIAQQVTSLVQVCDGRDLWTYRKLIRREMVSRIDAVRATAALQRAASMPGPSTSNILPGLGGLSHLLRGLCIMFQFDRAEQGRVGDLPVWKIEGVWKSAQLVKLLPKQKEAIGQGKPADLSRLPQHVPDRVVLLLGQEDLFPYRMDYCRAAIRKDEQAEPVEGRTLMTVEYFEVNFNVPIDPKQFIYSPGTVELCDETEAFLQSLGANQ